MKRVPADGPNTPNTSLRSSRRTPRAGPVPGSTPVGVVTLAFVLLGCLTAASVVILLAGAAPAGAAPAPGSELWRKTINGTGNGNDQAVALAFAPGGTAVYAAGSVTGLSATTDVALVKYGRGGKRLWMRSYDGTTHGNDAATCLVCDRAGNVYVGGWTESATHEDYLLVKYDATGHRRWVRVYDGANHGWDRVMAVAVDATGNLYSAGYTQGTGADRDGTLIKWSPTGVQRWVADYDIPAGRDNEFDALVIDKRRGRVFAGGNGYPTLTSTVWVLTRYTTSGARLWAQAYGAPDSSNWAQALAVTPGGGAIQVGSGGGTAVHPPDGKVVRWSATGTVVWESGYTGSDDDYLNDVALDRNGAVFAVGKTRAMYGRFDALVCRFAPDGTPGGTITIGHEAYDDAFRAVACDARGNVYATGVVGTPSYKFDWVTCKFDNSVNLVYWQPRAQENAVACHDEAADIVARSGTYPGVYVTGTGSQDATHTDWMTIKYKP